MLGLRLEELRNWDRLTREEMAQRTSLDPRQIADYELYGVWPDPEKLTRLSVALSVEIHELFDFTETRIHSLLPLEQRLERRQK